MEILRKKVNGATAVSKIRDVPASGVYVVPAEPRFKELANHVPPSSSSSPLTEDGKARAKNGDDEDGDEDEDDDVDIDNSDAAGSDKDPLLANNPKSTPSSIDSSVNLSGPVTDL